MEYFEITLFTLLTLTTYGYTIGRRHIGRVASLKYGIFSPATLQSKLVCFGLWSSLKVIQRLSINQEVTTVATLEASHIALVPEVRAMDIKRADLGGHYL